MSIPACGCSHGVSPYPWLTYIVGQFIGAPTADPVSERKALPSRAGRSNSLRSQPATQWRRRARYRWTEQRHPRPPKARQPRQDIEQHDAARRRPLREALNRRPPTQAPHARTFESAAPIAAGRATLQPPNAALVETAAPATNCASAIRAGPGTIATTVRSPPERRTARP